MVKVLRTQDDLSLAAVELGSGALALLPTETVYGIGVAVSAFSGFDAIPGEGTGYGRIFTLKKRDVAQTVPWLVDGPLALDRYGVDVPRAVRDLASAFWPGALTLVVQASSEVPTFMCAADGTVALRASASPVIQDLIRLCGSPLAVTSANTHGAPAPVSFQAVEKRILDGVDIAVDAGGTPCREASTIIAVKNGVPAILREGAVGARAIFEAL